MKNMSIAYTIIILLSYMKIFTMELAIMPTQDKPCKVIYRETTFDWINKKRQDSTITALLALKKSLSNDVSKVITCELFKFHLQEEYKDLEKICPLKLGNQEYIVEQLWQMSYNDRSQLQEKIHINFLRRMQGFDDEILPESTFREIIKILPNNMKDTLEVQVVPESCCHKYLPRVVGGTLTTLGLGLGVAGAVTTKTLFIPLAVIFTISGPLAGICQQFTCNQDSAISSQEIEMD